MNQEIIIRLGCFTFIFGILVVWEIVKPRRMRKFLKNQRWFNNLTIALLDTAIVRLLIPLVPVGMAVLAQERGWGLFNLLALPYPFEIVVAVAALDFTIYLQHLLFHNTPILWPFHLVHHVDLDLDVTSGVRFHPVESVISMGIKLIAVLLLGAPPFSVLVFEILLNSTALFNHSNIYIPPAFDRIIRLLIVTPDMHRVHHSVILKETNSNFGFTLSWWDRIIGTYQDQPAKGHHEMVIGIPKFLESGNQKLIWLLALPFLKQKRNPG
jgi:sterol desaturase/sphingolipid hydroxylase (fatty acid hydroxylase superfamily)